MDKQELTQRLAKRSRQSKAHAADSVDALIYQLWKDSRHPQPLITPPIRKRKSPESSSVQVKEL